MKIYDYDDREKIEYLLTYISQVEKDKELMLEYNTPNKIRNLLEEIENLKSTNEILKEKRDEQLPDNELKIKMTTHYNSLSDMIDVAIIEAIKNDDVRKILKINLATMDENNKELIFDETIKFITPFIKQMINDLDFKFEEMFEMF